MKCWFSASILEVRQGEGCNVNGKISKGCDNGIISTKESKGNSAVTVYKYNDVKVQSMHTQCLGV